MKNNHFALKYCRFIFLCLSVSACDGGPRADPAARKTEAPAAEKAEPKIDWKRKEIGPNVFLEVAGARRRVVVNAQVCLTKGFLEHLLTRDKAPKQHESILTADIDARHLHTALELAGAKAGRPAQFINEKGDEQFKPATGDPIQITLQWEQEGKKIIMPAQRWVRNTKTKKELPYDWVFVGSKLFPDPEKKEPYYGGNDGRVICTTNFTTAVLDLPIKSLDGDPGVGLDFEANEELIPPLETKVRVIFEKKKPSAK
jgi:hypothetical protein